MLAQTGFPDYHGSGQLPATESSKKIRDFNFLLKGFRLFYHIQREESIILEGIFKC